MADVGRKAITQVKQAAGELLTRRPPAEQATALAEKLATGIWTHDYPIWASTGKPGRSTFVSRGSPPGLCSKKFRS
jgi:hypothetical protein